MTTLEVSKQTGATLRQLQWWDETGLVIACKESGERRYDPDSLELVRAVMFCLRVGLTLCEVRKLREIHSGNLAVWVFSNRDAIRTVSKTLKQN